MAQLSSRHLSLSFGKSSSRLRLRFAQVRAWVQRALEASRQRRALYQLNDAALSDLGLSRAYAWQDAIKLFWKHRQRRSAPILLGSVREMPALGDASLKKAFGMFI